MANKNQQRINRALRKERKTGQAAATHNGGKSRKFYRREGEGIHKELNVTF